jgi:uncharacterized membrane protein YvlD (DUF360 family)
MKQIYATTLGLINSATIAGALLAVLEPIGGRSLSSYGFSFALFSFFTCVVAIVFGLPAFLVLNKFRWIRWWSATLSGALAGFISLLVFLSDKLENSKSILALVTIGAVAGFTFWIFWRAGNADKEK